MLRQFALKTLQTTSVRQLISAWCNCVAPREAPWFEQPAAEEVVKRLAACREIDPVDAERLRQWVRDGYFVVPNAVPASDIDAIGALLDGLAPQWEGLAYSAGVAIVLFLLGFWYFDRAKDDFESAL